MRRSALLAIGMGCLMSLADTAADTAAADIEKVTSIEGITEYRLDNGLKVLLFPDPTQPSVTVNLTVFVGSRHEGYGEAGMAHLLEHMLFKGTPDHPDIPKALTGRGASFNGTTWVDRTNYFETLPAEGDNLEFAIRLEADRLVNSYVKAEDLASEMSVVRNEFERGENSPSRVLAQKMMSAAYEWHNYGQSTIGNRADIERVPIESLKRFYVKYYQPDNAMLVVAGRFEPEKALELIEKYFGAIPAPERELEPTYTEEPAQDGERMVTLRRVGDVAAVGAVYHIPSGAHPEYPAVDVLAGCLGDSPSGRLYKSLVETRRAASVSAYAFAWHDPGAMRIMAEVAEGNEPQAVLDAMLDTIDEVAAQGVTEEEVERIKRKYLKYREETARDVTKLAIELSEWAALGDWRLYFLYRDRLEKVTVDDVNKAAKKYLRRNNRTVGLFIPTEKPQRTEIPQTPELAKMIGDYQGREVAAVGEAFDASPENIDEQTRRLSIGEGLRVALLPKSTRGNAVRLRLTLRYGSPENLSGRATACELLPTLMLRGTRELTRQQIQDRLDEYRSALSASGSAGAATFTMEADRENLPKVLDLLRQVLREPTLPASELDLMKQARLAAYEKQLNDPQALAQTQVRRHITPWPKDDPRYIPTVPEELQRIKAVTREQVQELYEQFLAAEHGELAIVGDFDPDETLGTFREMLAGWTSEKDYARLESKAVDVSGGFDRIETPDKANAVYFSALTVPMRDDAPDYPAMTIGNFILGGGSLSSRLADRVRQQEGLSYGVGSGFNASNLDRRAAFYAYAIYNPDNVEKVRTAIREEIERLLKDGVTERELAEAKEGFLQRQEVTRSDDSQLVATLAETLEAGRTMAYYSQLEKTVRNLTPEDVVQAMREHLDPEDLYTIVAGDFAKDQDADSE